MSAIDQRSSLLGPHVRLPAPHADVVLTAALPGDAPALVGIYSTPSIAHRLYSIPSPYVPSTAVLRPHVFRPATDALRLSALQLLARRRRAGHRLRGPRDGSPPRLPRRSGQLTHPGRTPVDLPPHRDPHRDGPRLVPPGRHARRPPVGRPPGLRDARRLLGPRLRPRARRRRARDRDGRRARRDGRLAGGRRRRAGLRRVWCVRPAFDSSAAEPFADPATPPSLAQSRPTTRRRSASSRSSASASSPSLTRPGQRPRAAASGATTGSRRPSLDEEALLAFPFREYSPSLRARARDQHKGAQGDGRMMNGQLCCLSTFSISPSRPGRALEALGRRACALV